MSEAVVTDSIVMEAPTAVVWSVITEPETVPLLDPRLALISTSGPAGTVGSGFVLRMSRGNQTLDITYAVVEATPTSRLVMTVRIGDREPWRQVAALAADGDDVALTWTMQRAVPWGLAAFSRRIMRLETRSWLDGIAAEVRRRT